MPFYGTQKVESFSVMVHRKNLDGTTRSLSLLRQHTIYKEAQETQFNHIRALIMCGKRVGPDLEYLVEILPGDTKEIKDNGD